MRQVWITRAGGPEVLQVREADDPRAGEGQVRIRVKAAGVNFADTSARMGMYFDAPPIPFVPGYEVAGVIDEVGAGVTGLRAGDRVFGMPKFGGYTDTLVVAAAQVFPMPEDMSFEEAAAMPVAYLTAHNTMLFTGHLRPGSTVLIHSAAGGVGIAAVQIARTRECVIIGTASPSKHEFLRSIGVQHPIDSGADYVPQVRAVVGDRGVDLVLDPVGGKSFKSGYDLLAPCGRLVAFGFSTATRGQKRNLLRAGIELVHTPRFSPLALMNDNRTVSGCNMAHLFDHLDLLRPQFEALLGMYRAGQIKPHVDRTFAFSEAPAAHLHLHARKAIGKVILVPDAPRALAG